MKSSRAIKTFLIGIFIVAHVVCYGQSKRIPSRENLKNLEVTIDTRTPEIKLAGTLSLAPSKRPAPAIILIWGNGPHTRDEIISGSPTFKQLADFFNSQGISVLRVDKRGFGNSTGPKGGSEDKTTTGDLADDIEDCYKFLSARNDIDSSNIGLMGHSEGAMIAPMVATRERGIKWIILLAPPAVRGMDIFLEQRKSVMRQRGLKGETFENIYAQWERFAQLIQKDPWNDRLYYEIGTDWSSARGESKDRITKESIDRFWSGFRTNWQHYFLNLDITESLTKIQIPVLAIFGSNDQQVTVGQNLLPLMKSLDEAGNNDYSIVVLPHHDHFFLTYQDKIVPDSEHKKGEMKISKKLLSQLRFWIKEQIIK